MEDLLSSLNTQQAEAVKHVAGPILILAGAGSGKTKALTTRIAYLLEKGVPPYSILAITFTNKAAKEMRERVDKLVGPLAKDVWLYTFHGFCNQLLRREIKHLSHYGYGTGFSIYDTTDCKNVLKGILKDLKMDEKFYPLSAVMSVISNAKNAQLSSAAFARKADDFHAKKVAEIYLEYEKRMRQNNAVDFDDLLLLSVDLLQHDRDVREKYQHKFQYVMIDEYQDTNHVQYLLAKLISAPENNLCAVGDIDQSIYGWRGADISNILDFEKIIPMPRSINSSRITVLLRLSLTRPMRSLNITVPAGPRTFGRKMGTGNRSPIFRLSTTVMKRNLRSIICGVCATKLISIWAIWRSFTGPMPSPACLKKPSSKMAFLISWLAP